MFRKLLAMVALGLPVAGHATWRAAESTHFIVYTEDSESSAKELATKLEKFDFVMRAVSNATRPSSPVKVKVFMLPSEEAVQATTPFPSGGIAGYYNAGARGPFAVMTRSDAGESWGLKAQLVLFHELTHHFMFQYFPATYPSWYIEGFADYYGTTEFLPNNVVQIGRRIDNRFLTFTGNDWLPVGKLLTAKSYADVGNNVLLMYAEGWLLVHYLATHNERAGQLGKYLKAINDGKSFSDAAKIGFGDDLDKLDHELRDYADPQRVMKTVILPFKPIDPGKIETRTLSDAEGAMIDDDISLYAGVAASNADAFADRVADTAKHYPDDPYALRILTEAQILAGRDAAANETVAHWLKVAPQDPMALLNQGVLATRALQAAKVTDPARWTAARRPIVTASQIDQQDPRVLRAYYDSFLLQGLMPPANAADALGEAFDLEPQDEDLRYELAKDYELRGDLRDAIAVIRPLAFQLHSDEDLSPKQKARAEHDKARYRIAGDDSDDHETPYEMLRRLEKKLGATAPDDGNDSAPAS